MRNTGAFVIRRRRSDEEGSALLIVFVFAAVIAIMLYREIPSATLEAERVREQELQDRGAEYVRAVQLFYRKNQRYPGSMEALEDTNRIRYLRRRFKDPLTDKDDWRLLHAGPGGTLIDSKVNRLPPMGQMGPNGSSPGMNGQVGTRANGSFGGGSGSSFGQSNSSSFGNNAGNGSGNNSALLSGVTTGLPATAGDGSTFGSGGAFANSSFASDGGPTITSLYRKRAPAIATANAPSPGGNTGASSLDEGKPPSSADLAADPSIPLVGGAASSNSGGAGNTSDSNAASPNANGTNNNSNGTANAAGASTMQAVGNLLANGQAPANSGLQQNSSGMQSMSGNSGGGQQLNSGGIAGVASKAKGKTLKKVADQKDFSLWEFYYDPNQDTSMKAAGSSGPAGGPINGNLNGTTPGQAQPGAAPGFTPATTSFNNSSNAPNNAGGNGNSATGTGAPSDGTNPNNPQAVPNGDVPNNNNGTIPSPPPAPLPTNPGQQSPQ